MLRSIIRSNPQETFIKRWPKAPKVVFFASPNSFQDELITRFSIDLGLPIISMTSVYANIQQYAGKQEEFSHPFYLKVKDMLDAGDIDQLTKDRVALKLLRVTNKAREGFILTDFPRVVSEAEMLEEYRGGMNAFVHLSVPDDVQVQIEETKANCGDCGRTYYPQIIENVDQGIRIDSFLPQDGHCFDCGSTNIRREGNAAEFERVLKNYKDQKDELLGFYSHLGLLVDFEIKEGYADYAKLRDQIQFNIKH